MCVCVCVCARAHTGAPLWLGAVYIGVPSGGQKRTEDVRSPVAKVRGGGNPTAWIPGPEFGSSARAVSTPNH